MIVDLECMRELHGFACFPSHRLLRINHAIFRDGSICVGFSIVWKVCVLDNYCFYAVAVKLVVQVGVLTRAPLVFCPFKIYAGMLNRFVFL